MEVAEEEGTEVQEEALHKIIAESRTS